MWTTSPTERYVYTWLACSDARDARLQVSVDESVCSSGEEDLSTALHHVTTAATQPLETSQPQPAEVGLTLTPTVCVCVCVYIQSVDTQEVREEVVEDFVRNFLVRVGLHKTADIFQAEW